MTTVEQTYQYARELFKYNRMIRKVGKRDYGRMGMVGGRDSGTMDTRQRCRTTRDGKGRQILCDDR